jgi:hypothetical protein
MDAYEFWSVSAVWKNCEALVQHLKGTKHETGKEKSTYECFQDKITFRKILLDLRLMCDKKCPDSAWPSNSATWTSG